ncbi:S-adenosyl-L-methionine-dependent methyltransferase [Schizopora paradoxa]|uniref:phosphoethanolamine N-methyltransferase n=1 Tax=Schizopora paradoxa TaxID=27342 RepID=A0A0H2RQT6_9AGAM|nr:S-adenosyl-L-methionine-dependent methyltransferase [Schizopora paradoxa]
MGLWPFVLKRSVVTTDVVHAPFERVQEVLRDPPALITLNPLVVGYELQPGTDDTYIITDKLRVLGIPFTSKYTAQVTKGDEITTFIVKAGAGTSSTNIWKWVVQANGDGVEVTEEAKVEAPFLTILFVVSTIKRTHKILLQQLKSKLEGKEESQAKGDEAQATPKRKKELYDMSHLELNKLPGDDPNTAPKSEWLNMGYWKSTSSFPEACTNLCDEVLHAARITSTDRVLDVGHACGDSLLHIISQLPSGLPLSLTGITSLPAHYEKARTRVENATRVELDGARQPEIRLHLGDVIYRPSSPPNHPFKPLGETDPFPFDKILALDCAYHFETRKVFFEQAFGHLSPGGRIALADICLPATSGSFLRRMIDATGALMPRENMVTIDEYETQLRRVGFEDVSVRDITDDVFPGFRAFLRTKGWRWLLTEWVVGLYAADGARFVLASAEKPRFQ